MCKVEVGQSYKLRWLAERWKWCNTHMFGGSMREPKFVIGRKGKNALGVWRRLTREMEIAHRMFDLKDEAHALGTLIHEMAHQYNDEVEFTPPEHGEEDIITKGHGPTWKSIMRRLGQPDDAEFTGQHTELFNEKQREALRNISEDSERIRPTNAYLQTKEKHYLVYVNKNTGTEKIYCVTNIVRPKEDHSTYEQVAGFSASQLKTPDFTWVVIQNCYVAMPGKVKKEAPELLTHEASVKHENVLRHLASDR
jgi:hypothetical protein